MAARGYHYQSVGDTCARPGCEAPRPPFAPGGTKTRMRTYCTRTCQLADAGRLGAMRRHARQEHPYNGQDGIRYHLLRLGGARVSLCGRDVPVTDYTAGTRAAATCGICRRLSERPGSIPTVDLTSWHW